MIKWIQTRKLSIKNSLSDGKGVGQVGGEQRTPPFRHAES